jgi:hypothetical protein
MDEEESRLLEIGAYTFRLTKNPNGTYKSEALPQTLLPNAPISLPYIPPGGRTLAIFESESKPGEKHYVMLSPNGDIRCTCWGFRAPDHCWHYRGMIKILEDIPIGKILEPIKVGFTRT